MSVTLQFLGAAGTVTGSKYLVKSNGKQILVDAGMFQGAREWRERNWDTLPCKLEEIDAVLLTHAHIDHTGILPRLYKLGLRCPVYASNATIDLTKLLLIDSAKLQEEEASYREARGRSRHIPTLPLYSETDAQECLKLLRGVPFDEKVTIVEGISARWSRMGHILGAAAIELEIGRKVINFSGDIGRYSVPILVDPQPIKFHDLLLIESTYGDRLHGAESPKKELARIINETVQRHGIVLIPSFAVGRTQELLYYLRELKEDKEIPDIPVIVDSPMAQDATSIYSRHPDCYDKSSKDLLSAGKQPFKTSKLYFVRERDESIKLNAITDPMVLISASGMLSGGRILHHLKHRISAPQNTILFVGFQPPGGRGDWIKSGAKSLQILGEEIAIRAKVDEISGLSAHADVDELMRWCQSCEGKPGRVAVVHGEPASAEHFRQRLTKELGWNAFTAGYLQEISI